MQVGQHLHAGRMLVDNPKPLWPPEVCCFAFAGRYNLVALAAWMAGKGCKPLRVLLKLPAKVHRTKNLGVSAQAVAEHL